MDKILVTGVAGFIGSNLANKLLENENNIVYGIDDFSSSTMSNLYPLLKNERFIFQENDLKQDIFLSVDYIYHCAGCGDYKNYFLDKFDFINREFETIRNIISYSQLSGSRLLILSEFMDNDLQDFELLSSFINLKENLISNLIQEGKLNANIVRLGEVYGENMQKNSNRLIPKSIQKALNNELFELNEIKYYSFQYVQDVVANLIKIMQEYQENPIINLVCENLTMEAQAIEEIISELNSKSILRLNSSIEKQNTLPKTSNNIICLTPLKEGLRATIEHYKLMYLS